MVKGGVNANTQVPQESQFNKIRGPVIDTVIFHTVHISRTCEEKDQVKEDGEKPLHIQDIEGFVFG